MEGEPTGRRPLPPAWTLFGAAALLVAVTGHVSFLELVGRLAGPLALVLLFRIDPMRAILAAAAGFLILAAVTRDPAWAARTALPVAVSGVILARAMAVALRPSLAVAEASIPFLLIAVVLVANPMQGGERAEEIDRLVQGSMAINQEMKGDVETLEMMERLTRQMVEAALVVTPAALYLYFLALTAVVYRMAGALLRRFGLAFRELAPFAEWRAPFPLVWLFAAGLAGALIGGAAVRNWAANALFVSCAVYFVQGLSVLAWQFRKRGISLVVRVLFYVAAVLLVFPFFMVATAGTGLFDTWFDFRRLDRDRESEDNKPWK